MSKNVAVFFQQKGKNLLIINIVSGGRGELAWCPNFFVWDCGSVSEEVFSFHSFWNERGQGWRGEAHFADPTPRPELFIIHIFSYIYLPLDPPLQRNYTHRVSRFENLENTSTVRFERLLEEIYLPGEKKALRLKTIRFKRLFWAIRI